MNTNDMQISEAQLLCMTRDLDEMHRDTFPAFRAAVDAACSDVRGHVAHAAGVAGLSASRRSFLVGSLATAGAVGGGMVLAACGGTADTGPASTPGITGDDLRVARLAASLEVLAVNTYAAALAAGGTGKPLAGAIPPAVVQFANTAQLQHQDHADAWNASLVAAGQASQKDPDPKLNSSVQTALGAVKTTTDLAKLALMLENVALQTYVTNAGVVTGAVARAQALTIAPVEAQHAAILNFVLGQYPVPDTFVPQSLARTTSDVG